MSGGPESEKVAWAGPLITWSYYFIKLAGPR